MLKLLRKKGVAKKILWVVAIIIIISFGFFGTANRLSNRENISYAGKIFGQKVSFDQFEKSLLHARYQAILRYGENFNKISQFIDLEGEAWERLILLYEAQKRRIRIIDQEVVDTIEDFDFFKSNGKFDPDIYKKIVRYIFRCEPREFEEGIRESLIFAKLYEQETSSVTLPEEEIKKEYGKQNDQVQVSYILFSGDDYKKDVTAEPQETQNYYNQHKNEFLAPTAINIQYFMINYSGNPAATEKENAAAKAESISKELQTDPDLEKTAKKHSLQIKESGFFSEENSNFKNGLPLEIMQKAFSLEKGQVSKPIETSKGYYIFRIKDKKGSHIPDYEEVSEKVKDALILNKARELAKQKATEYLKQIKETLKNMPQENFADLIKTLDLKTSQTPIFSRGQYLPTIGLSSEFQETAFSLNDQNKISDVVETVKGYSIIHLDSYVAADKEKFEKEKDNFTKTLATQKKNEVFGNFVSRLRTKANLEDNVTKLKKNRQPY